MMIRLVGNNQHVPTVVSWEEVTSKRHKRNGYSICVTIGDNEVFRRAYWVEPIYGHYEVAQLADGFRRADYLMGLQAPFSLGEARIERPPTYNAYLHFLIETSFMHCILGDAEQEQRSLFVFLHFLTKKPTDSLERGQRLLGVPMHVALEDARSFGEDLSQVAIEAFTADMQKQS